MNQSPDQTDSRPSPRSRTRRYLIFLAVAILAAYLLYPRLVTRPGRPYLETARTFDGPSTDLEQTVVLASLDSPIPAGRNAIWCASFQLAWDRLKLDVVKEPIRIDGAEELCTLLNNSPFNPRSLPDTAYYAVAGWVEDGIIGQITSEMATRFPDVAPQLIPDERGVITVAYGYLTAGIKFTIPFFERQEPLSFQDSLGAEHVVAAFGIRSEDVDSFDNDYVRLREQVHVLYADFPSYDDSEPARLPRFAIDLDRHSQPFQVALACVDPGATLATTYNDVQGRIGAFMKQDPPEDRFGVNEVLLVPTQAWRINHHFRELESGRFQSATLSGPVVAMLSIDFKLDRSGVELSSETLMEVFSLPRLFIFDRPFLLYMKMRDADQPFLVMWIDNAELLVPFAPNSADSEPPGGE